MNFLLNSLDQIGRAQVVYFLIVNLVIIFGGFAIWSKFFFKKERRLFNNLKRKVYFIKIKNAELNLEKEAKLISENGMFKTDATVREYAAGYIETISEKAVLVISYAPDFTNYDSLINSAKAKNTPVIIFAKSGKITNQQHMQTFEDYPYLQICNGTSRLLSSLFNICATTPL